MSAQTNIGCGACAGVTASTPSGIDNRPGLPTISVRVGNYTTFLRSMLAGLSDTNRPALAPLTARTSDDFSIAVLDAFAVVADIHTFYQQQFAQESYLRTATERRSILELARLIGYELSPGVAAHTSLAFGMETTAGTPTTLKLPSGTLVQSTPGPGQQAQAYESIEGIIAQRAFSALTPRLTQTAIPKYGDLDIWLQGTSLNLKPGDPLVLIGSEKITHNDADDWDFRRIAAVEVNAARGFTHVTLEIALALDTATIPSVPPQVFVLRRQASLFGYNAQKWLALPIAQRVGEWNPKTYKVDDGVYSTRQNSWTDAPLAVGQPYIYLDAVYPQITNGGWIVLADAGYNIKPPAQLYHVTSTADTNQADYGLTGRVTRVGIAGIDMQWFSPSTAAVYAQSEFIALAERPLMEPLDTGSIQLSSRITGLTAGQSIIVAGKRARVLVPPGVTVTLTALDFSGECDVNSGEQLWVLSLGLKAPNGKRIYTLQTLDGFSGTVFTDDTQLLWTPPTADDPVLADLTTVADTHDSPELLYTTIDFATALTHAFDLNSVIVYANVAMATAGKTVQELLGSGDASASFQSFTLKQPPLTYVAAATPSGVASTLQVFCNDLAWTQVDTLYGQGPRAQVFTTRHDENGNTTVLFGDGVTYGARLPTGSLNIRAVYRTGIGNAGNVDAGQINVLLSRPLGLKSVTNPLPAIDGADPEPQEQARANAPLSVSTLGRAVSIKDYENFALGFAGIAKALATWTWDGTTRGVVLTLAGIDGAPVPANGQLAGNLAKALADFGDATVPVNLQTYAPVTFQLGINILINPLWPSDAATLTALQASVTQALRAAFGFQARYFGQWVSLSEVLEVAQTVDGVQAVQITQLYRSDDPYAGLNQILVAAAAPSGGQGAAPAELLTLDPGPLVTMGVMS
ncbi:putative baseplate assembly protein [Dyella tabacisoli]|uniref:Putative baseplate assembly protein n=1 Tax=Dyella tabacisoli TaxID=2282381 RepID=A0A369UNA5_9GAMM|nr:putative baseplate assembly protein [Dyella tabacisoli]RDD82116.1 putative baseplate assembly protein [Dyella tabacisoli]